MITSYDNKRIKNVVSLCEKSKARKEQDAFVIEGIKLFEEAPDESILEVFISESFSYKSEKLDRMPVEVVKDDVFKKMTDTLTPQGILCVVRKASYKLEDLVKLKKNPLFIVLEKLQDPGNLGTIMRTAEGAGATGSIFRVPFVYTDDLKKAIGVLKNEGVTCYAAHLKGTKDCYSYDYKKPTAFFIGNEGNGLSDEISDLADTYIKIPMGGKLESLNAAVSAAVLMYETGRQRGFRE